MNTITNLNTFPIGNSLDGINIITDEINTLSLLVDGTNSMLADLNMNNHIIKNMEAGVDSLDAVNKSQLDLKADTTYVNTQLALKVNKAGDTMTGALNMNTTNKIINLANGTSNGDAVNRSQLNTKADTSYVNTQLALKVNKAGDTMTGALNMNSTNKIINLANGTSIGDAVNLGQLTAINNSLTADINDLENYVDAQDTALRTYTDSSLNSLRDYVNTQDTALRTYTDSSLNSLRDYVNTQDTALRTYTDSSLNSLRDYVNTQDNLKVNKAGDTMTGQLLLNFTNANLDVRATDENQDSILYLSTPYQNGAVDRRKTAIIADGINNWNRANLHFCLNQQQDHTSVVSVSDSRMCILNNGNVGINTTTPSERLDVNGNAIVRGNLDMNSNKIINVANATDSTDAINKSQLDSVDTNIRNDTYSALNLKVNKAGDTMTGNLNISLAGTSTTTHKQLNLQTNNNGLWFNPYFSPGSFNPLVQNGSKGIIFSNGTVNTGELFIAPWSEFNYGLQISSTGATTIHGKLLRNAWNSGELIQTKIYNQNNSGTGILQINAGSGGASGPVLWKSIDFTMLNDVNDSILTVEVFAPYHISGEGQDTVFSQIRDFTENTEQQVLFTSQYYDGDGGGGTRSGIISPIVGSYTPSSNTSNKTRKIQVRFNNLTNDTLYICRIVTAGGVTDSDYYTIKVSEYKI